VNPPKLAPWLEAALRWALALFMVVAGVMHFVAPRFYEQIVPPPLPATTVVVLSGLAEIALGVGLAFEPTRRAAAWGTVALLVAVFPANVYLAISSVELVGLPAWMPQPSTAARYGRLPVQLVFLAWAWLVTRPDSDLSERS
jgi:uncharacterized membrane protein